MKLNPEYYFYDSKLAVSPAELQDLYRFTRWGTQPLARPDS